ncbi:tyrosine-type recombinase/integrase [Luteibacter sp. ME-Dv--P-043b]|uniref:tyrosine-type recombinase/integrase n=1 Tax=Luteibacter sp. ME-Dv--P-043b TaxID=3040291 RepID=UPI00255602A0|nr:tyrosine-type recombinase/integrase [Luteibacter sp. ME-Dv--P-043b]
MLPPARPPRASQVKDKLVSVTDGELARLIDVAGAGLVAVTHAVSAQLGGRPFRFALSEAQLASAAAYIAQQQRHATHGLAPNSRRTRAADWLTWLAFCAHYDRVVLPATFDDVREFLDQLVAAGRRKATLEHILWSLADIHRRHGCPNPMDSAIARDYWKDLVRERVDGEQCQAAPMTLDVLDALVVALHAEPLVVRRVAPAQRRLAEQAQRRRRYRDIALFHVAYDLLMRSSELVAMTWEQIEPLAQGGGTYRFGRTKTDQVGAGRTLYLRPESMAALRVWREVADPGKHVFHAVADDRFLDPAGAANATEALRWTARQAKAQRREIVPLSSREVSNVFRRAAGLAGLDPASHWLSGHSARVGAAQDMVRAGSTTAQVQIAGRWGSERMPIRYAERVMAEDAGLDRFARLTAMRDRSRT